jgi:hypothetical protein
VNCCFDRLIAGLCSRIFRVLVVAGLLYRTVLGVCVSWTLRAGPLLGLWSLLDHCLDRSGPCSPCSDLVMVAQTFLGPSSVPLGAITGPSGGVSFLTGPLLGL